MAVYLALLILLVFPAATISAALPACLQCHPVHRAELGSCTGCHLGDERTARKNVAHRNLIPGTLLQYRIPCNGASEAGLQWIEQSACRRCHRINGKGNTLAANLDKLKGRHPLALSDSIIKPVTYMPDFRFDQKTAGLIVNAIQSFADRENDNSGKPPVTVRFNSTATDEKNIFEKSCGGCHKLLTLRLAGLGHGNVGPNLAGLFTDFYPKSYGSRGKWTPNALESWLNNPRKSRPQSRMQPVNLSGAQFKKLLEIMNSPTSSAKSR